MNKAYDGTIPHGLGGEKFDSISSRHAFILRVYNILFVQLLVTFGFTALAVLNDATREWIQARPGLIWVAFILAIGLLIAMACKPSLARKSPTNYFMCGIFTLCMTFMVAISASFYDVSAVMYAAGITTFITLALSLFACQTKIDFTGMGGYLMAALFGLIGFGFVLAIACGAGECEIAQTIYAWLGATIFSLYIVYDTQLIVGGSHRTYQFDESDHVFAAITLYLDIINLFLFILRILGGNGRSDD